jgi:uridine kinase
MKSYDALTIAKEIVRFCVSTHKKFLFISGNGASGKTELGKIISKEMAEHGKVNVLEMDGFVVDTTLRNNATMTWEDIQKKKQTGRYTTSCEASYFLPSIKAILHTIEKGNDYYHWTKKAKKSEESVLLHGDAVLTILEGVGTVFLEKEKSNSLSVFLFCGKELEIARRIKRARADNEKNIDEINKSFDERNSQYEAIVKPHISEYDLVLESMQDFSLYVVRDDLDVLK